MIRDDQHAYQPINLQHIFPGLASKAEEMAPGPNRAQRRAQARKDKAAARRATKAYAKGASS